jgi:GT2 family glycosyltransferase
MTKIIPELTPRSFEGELVGRSENYLIGWARNIAHPNEVVTLDLIGDGQWLGLVRAEFTLAYDDMPAEAIGHGFMFTIKPRQWQAIARFEAWVTNQGLRLSGVIFSHQEKPVLPQVQNNHVTVSGGLKLVGWAWDSLDAEVSQKIIAYEAGRVIAEGIANLHSEELEAAGLSNSKHGFSLSLPLVIADGNVHKIEVVRTDGKALNGSPVTVVVPTTSLKNWADSLALPTSDQAFLSAVMKRYDWYVPVSADFSCYREWSDRFGILAECADSIMPVLVCISGADDMEKTIASLVKQSHSHWLALVCSDDSLTVDKRIKCIKPSQWLKQLQKAVTKATGIVSFVMAGDTLAPDALATLVEVFKDPCVQIAYTDCDQVSDDANNLMPWFKPDWDPDLFLATTPLHYLFATRAEHLAGSSPYLAQLEAWPWLAVHSVGDDAGAIYHIPRVLYHQRQAASAPVHLEAQRLCDTVLAPELTRILSATNEHTLLWPNPTNWPTVSLIIPTRDHVDLLKSCIESLLKTDYPAMDIIVVDNDSADKDALSYLASLKQKKIRVIHYPGPFNFSKINNHAVQQAKASIIGLINNDIEATHSDWLKAMVRQLLRPNVGAVGAKLLWPNGMVQHAGVVLGLNGLAGHTGNDWYKDDFGYFGYNQSTHSVSAVTAACLLCKREDYVAVGGLDENDFPVNFNDVDFCLKLRTMGKRIIWTPEAQLLHAESASRGADRTPDRRGRVFREQNRLMQKWHHWIVDDPYYNPNLNLDAYSYAGLAIPPRLRMPLKKDAV